MIGILITITAFSVAYLASRWLEGRKATGEQPTMHCVACGKSNFTVVILVTADGAYNPLLCMPQHTAHLEALWGLRCNACGHVMLYREPI